MIFGVGAHQGVIRQKTRMLFSFTVPKLTIGFVDLDVLFFYLKKDLMDKHAFVINARARRTRFSLR